MKSETFMKLLVRNQPTISDADQRRLAACTAVVVGCGGIGGYALEFLVRLGVGGIRVIDGDSFDRTNLNRQILCTVKTIGEPKVEAAVDRARSINPEVRIEGVHATLDTLNAVELVRGADVAVDALDNAASRVVLEAACAKVKVPLVHAAVRGKVAQLAVVHPGEMTLARLYQATGSWAADAASSEDVPPSSCLSFTPPLAASFEISEALKVMLEQERGIGSGEVLLVDAGMDMMQTLRV